MTIFLGSGEHSKQQIDHLHAKVDVALSILGGLQQPPHSDSWARAREAEKERKEWEEELKEKLLDILLDFGYEPETKILRCSK